MPTKSIKKRILELSLGNKLTGIGAAVGVISVFLPWYLDVDKFNAGYRFLGITGPLYAIGGTLLLGFGVSLAMTVSDMLGKKVFSFPFKKSTFNMSLGAASFYLVFLAYSIYFHHQFGLYIEDKQPRIGFLFAFFASIIVGYGGYMILKEEGSKRSKVFADEHLRIEKSVPDRDHSKIVQDVKEKVETRFEKSLNGAAYAKKSNDLEPATTDIPIKSEIRHS